MDMHAAVLRNKDRIASACRRNRVARLEIFGSAARVHDFEPGRSDVDFLVEFEPGLAEDPYLTLRDEFERIVEGHVDLLDRRALDNSRNYIRRAQILSESEIVFVA